MKFFSKYFSTKSLTLPSKSFYFSSDSISNLQMFNELLEKSMSFTKIIGANIFADNYQKLNLRFALTFFYLTFLFIINIYDVYLFRNDLVRDVFCVLTISGEIQSYAKIYIFIFLRDTCVELKKSGEKLHKSVNSIKDREIFELWMMRTAHLGGIIIFMYIICCFVLINYPIIFYLLFGERILHFGIEIPMLDWKNSWIAYSINFLYQSTGFIIFTLASIPSIMIFVTFIMTSFAYFEVLSDLIKELDECVIDNEDGKNSQNIKEKLKSIVEMHLELNK